MTKGRHEPGQHRKGATRLPHLPRTEFSKGTLNTTPPPAGTVYGSGKRTSILGKFLRRKG